MASRLISAAELVGLDPQAWISAPCRGLTRTAKCGIPQQSLVEKLGAASGLGELVAPPYGVPTCQGMELLLFHLSEGVDSCTELQSEGIVMRQT